MMIRELPADSTTFAYIQSGELNCVILRLSDFRVGEQLLIQEKNGDHYTGRHCMRPITAIVQEMKGLQEGFVMLSLDTCAWEQEFMEGILDPAPQEEVENGFSLQHLFDFGVELGAKFQRDPATVPLVILQEGNNWRRVGGIMPAAQSDGRIAACVIPIDLGAEEFPKSLWGDD